MQPEERVVEQEQPVVAALAQRRHAQHEVMEAEEEVVPELLGDQHLLERPVRGGDDPDVDSPGGVGAERLELSGGERTQQDDLRAHVQIGDLVEEDHPAVACLEGALAIDDRPGETALPVAEQLAHRQVAILDTAGSSRPRRACPAAARAGRSPAQATPCPTRSRR